MENYQINLIANQQSSNMYSELYSSIKSCNSFIFSVAFINYSGLQLLIKALDEIRNTGVKGKVLTSDYLNFTEPKALRKLLEFENIQTKIFLQERYGGFHTKAYIFEYDEEIKLFIGSSNITENALLRNVEWNVKVISKRDHPMVVDIYDHFIKLWEKSEQVNEDFLEGFETFIEELQTVRKSEKFYFHHEDTVRPNSMQIKAIKQLHQLRTRAEDRGLVIAATATGKTYMSAFDVQQFEPNRMLFIAHREDILIKAEQSYKVVLGAKLNTGILSGNRKDFDAKYLFATVTSLGNYLSRFNSNTFDYIIIDEAHHAVADSYQRILNYFKPKFLLGMTATPERTDGYQLFSLFNNNIALEIRLHDAIESELVVPFHYFGITEAEGIDLSTIDESDLNALTKRLSVHHRVTYIIEKLRLYGHEGKKLKALGFCASIEHAKYMTREFNALGIKSHIISGENNVSDRESAIKLLESDEPNTTEVIFSVDVFNEGIDIPSINTVLMLRPTSSPIIFVQQLGRGLRKSENKSFVTVLDFIGNYKKSFLIAIALKGSQYIDKDSLRVSVKNNFSDLPGTAFVQMDEITKEQILRQLENENFNSLKYLKDEYYSFRSQNNNSIPFFLMQYEYFEASPDPIRFVSKEGTYQNFLLKVEDTQMLSSMIITKQQMAILKQLSFELPLRRPFEYILLSGLIDHESLTLTEIKNLFSSYISSFTDSAINHTLNRLLGEYLDRNQNRNFLQLINYDSDNKKVCRSNIWNHILRHDFLPYFKDLLNYGLTRYSREFQGVEYFCPFFIIGKTYSMKNAAMLAETDRNEGAFFGSGLITYKKHYFIYVNLTKDEDIKEELKFKDHLKDLYTMQWESPNSMSENSPAGQNLIMSEDKGIQLHMFVRKLKKIDGLFQPFIYLGRVTHVSHQSNNPIRFIFKFETPLTKVLFDELTINVDLN